MKVSPIRSAFADTILCRFRTHYLALNLTPKCSALPIKVMIVIQGGGAKGGWQGGVLEALIDSKTVTPVASIGSSAGAINSWLLSAKLGDPSKPLFRNFWTTLPSEIRKEWRVAAGALNRLPYSIYHVAKDKLGFKDKHRLKPMLPFESFRDALAKHLPATPTKIHTYLLATNIDHRAPLPVYDSQRPCTFGFNPGSLKADIYDNDILNVNENCSPLEYADAIAVSCALPMVAPLKIAGLNYSDGGLYSNLPVNVCIGSGGLGGDCIICISPYPLKKLNPADYIHYRTLSMLRRMQIELIRKSKNISQTPLFVIEPPSILMSGTLLGFFSGKLQSSEYQKGYASGLAFARSLVSLLDGDLGPIAAYDLIRKKLPPPGKLARINHWWTNWVNPAWK
ncbi:patatin-like phospholipase family protein [Bdellovibrionota bacterium FG-2]